MSHTPEPWKKSHNGRDLELIVQERAGFNMVIAELKHPDIGGELANAARIVACVNGCAGLNPAAYREIIEAAKCLFTTHRQENDWDRLRKALTHAQEQP